MNARDRRALVVGGIALAAIALVWLVILPLLADWTAVRQRIAESQQRLETLHEQMRQVIVLDRELEPSMGAAVTKPLPSVSAARTQFIKVLMDLHARAGAGIQSLQPEADRPVRELPGVVRLAVQVQSTCRPLQLVKLLDAARNSPSLLMVDRLEAASARRPGGQPHIPSGGPPPAAGPAVPLNVTIVWSTLARQGVAP